MGSRHGTRRPDSTVVLQVVGYDNRGRSSNLESYGPAPVCPACLPDVWRGPADVWKRLARLSAGRNLETGVSGVHTGNGTNIVCGTRSDHRRDGAPVLQFVAIGACAFFL